MELRNFFNQISNNNRIFSAEDVGAMSIEEYMQNEKAIDFQMRAIGIPRNLQLQGNEDVVFVREYIRSDGTKVRAHYRSKGVSGPENILNRIKTGEETNIEILIKFLSQFVPIAGSNVKDAMYSFENARKNESAFILNSKDEIVDKGLRDLLDKIKVPKNSRGVIYSGNSEQSKILWNTPEIQEFVKNNHKKLLENRKNETVEIEFKFNPGNIYESDAYFGLQHCKLYNPRIENGYFTGIIVDYYDFNYRNKNQGNKLATEINNWGYSMQEKDHLENIFIIYCIDEKL